MKLIELRALIVVVIVSMSMVALSGLLIPSTYAITECDAMITSDPPGADVYIGGVYIGKTPYLHYVGVPFSADIIVEMEGFETWTTHIDVEARGHELVIAVLTPLQAGIGDPAIVTKTVTSTVTTTSPTTITATTITTTTATTTVTANTITITSSITTATTSTVVSEVTEQTGLPAAVSYGAIGIAVIAVITAAIIATRKRS